VDGIHVEPVDIGEAVAFCQLRIPMAGPAGARKIERIDLRFWIAHRENAMRIAVAIKAAGKHLPASHPIGVDAAAIGRCLCRMAGIARYLWTRLLVGESADIRMTACAAEHGVLGTVEYLRIDVKAHTLLTDFGWRGVVTGQAQGRVHFGVSCAGHEEGESGKTEPRGGCEIMLASRVAHFIDYGPGCRGR